MIKSIIDRLNIISENPKRHCSKSLENGNIREKYVEYNGTSTPKNR